MILMFAVLAGAIGYGGVALGWALAPKLFGFGWLAALSVWIAWPLGAMALMLIHALTGGRWGKAAHHALAAGVRSVFLIPLFVIPYALTAHRLYPWLQAGAAQVDNALYLNGPAFVLRGVIYLLIWLVLAVLVTRAAENANELARLAPPALILLALTTTFAVIDAIMSLEPTSPPAYLVSSRSARSARCLSPSRRWRCFLRRRQTPRACVNLRACCSPSSFCGAISPSCSC